MQLRLFARLLCWIMSGNTVWDGSQRQAGFKVFPLVRPTLGKINA